MSEFDPGDKKSIEEHLVRLLARREHSQQELVRKLMQKGFDVKAVRTVLSELELRGWQSDQRFSESFVRQRIMQRKGPLRIRADLQQRGVEKELSASALTQEATDWRALAVETLARKFNCPAGRDPKGLAKRQRFLANRGFTMEQINYAISVTESDEFEWL